MAVIECVPAAKAETVSCTELLDMLAVPREFAPSMNVTLPVAVIPAGGWIVAVNVTDCP